MRKQECRGYFSRQFFSWSSETTWFQSLGNLLYQSRLWRISKRAGQTSWRIRSGRKSTSRNSDQKCSWSGRIEEGPRKCELDDYSRNELRESRAAIQELTSQIQELPERMSYMNDSWDFQDIESICSWKLSHVPSQPAVVLSLRSMLSLDQRLRSVTWEFVRDTWKRFWQSTSSNRFITDTLSRNSSL